MKLFDMLTREDIQRIKDDRGELDLTKRIEELEKSLSIALEVNDKYQRENKDLRKRAEEAEGEVTIVKGIGQNSPEMKALQKEVEELKAELARAKEEHQYDNMVHQKELNDLR
jgi:regulator of replication initiation timing